ncbi:hypothetical protein F7R04_19390 [Agrobacterium radiobacter]|nr:hypothetical protein F7R04_19390 [Agrobacterium tumefaciens]
MSLPRFLSSDCGHSDQSADDFLTLAPPTLLIPVLVTGIQLARVCAAGRTPFSPRTWAGWIPVTSTGMRGRGVMD